MMWIRRPTSWQLSEREATPEGHYLSRREMLIGAAAVIASGCVPRRLPAGLQRTLPATALPYPFPRNQRYGIDRTVTSELVAASHNNFYEFGSAKDGVWRRTAAFRTEPWTVEIGGLVARPQTLSIDDLLRTMPHEERVYRHRCVEAWSMAVPWSGFPLRSLLRRAEPQSAARYVRFLSFGDRGQMPGIAEQPRYGWPYYEALRLDEAMNELAFVATGIYGHALPKQHGAPLRIVVPWKYGYKSPKSIVRIELVERKPSTFWNDIAPNEYSFESNVEPAKPHPRWSQLTEHLIGTLDVRRTLRYNGYEEFVKQLYR